MLPHKYPQQQTKSTEVTAALRRLIASKSQQENIALGLNGKLARALEKSNRIMTEDIIREAGYMLPQSDNSRKFLQTIIEAGDDSAKEKAARLLELL
jgi:hypothetical protein